jgi:hypothetical protein
MSDRPIRPLRYADFPQARLPLRTLTPLSRDGCETLAALRHDPASPSPRQPLTPSPQPSRFSHGDNCSRTGID